jgi:signal transduction histidine kinase
LDSDTIDILQKSHSASKSLVYVIDDLLRVSSAQQSHFSHLEATFDIKASILEILESLGAHARSKGLTFEYVNNGDPPSLVKGDAHQLRQILIQIVTNAVRFTQSGGINIETKVVSTSSDEFCFLEICVRDTGEGLTQRQLGMFSSKNYSIGTCSTTS